MGRIIIPAVLILLFAGWVVYHVFIKRDFKNQLNNFYLGLVFTAIWMVIYYFMFS